MKVDIYTRRFESLSEVDEVEENVRIVRFPVVVRGSF